MTQFSFPWSCAVAGDGGTQSYTVEVVEAANRIFANLYPTTDGVVYWTDSTVFPGYTVAVDGLLLPEYMGAEVVRVHPGIGLVQGWLYFNAPDLGYPQYTVSGGNAGATDIIGLRRDLVAQTVRLFYGRGAAGNTYPLVQTDAVWEIPIAEITLDGAGNYSSMSDVRRFVKHSSAPPEKRLFYNAVGGWNYTDSLALPITYTVATINDPLMSHVTLAHNKDSVAVTTIMATLDMPLVDIGAPWVLTSRPSFDFRAILYPSGAGGDIRYSLNFYYGGFKVGTAATTLAMNAQATSDWFSVLYPTTSTAWGEPDSIARGLTLMYTRHGTDVLDTSVLPSLVQGFEVRYNGLPVDSNLILPVKSV